ncbi:MAG TPA: dihydrolipoamide acetyltransferase family protein [Polyangium sp.]|nr:dihydrolipoamide acetyltransferase family protein [Polyangium sp.]
MAKVLDMPKLSPTMEEGQISVWHKKVGDTIAVDDLLAEVETDKATMEYRSFDKGTILAILKPAGSLVRLGEPVAIIGAPGEDISKLQPSGGAAPAPAPAPPAPAAPTPAPAPATPAPVAPVAPVAAAPTPAPAPAAPTPPAEPGRVRASPYVRKQARERGLELVGVTGSGPNGRIVARDLDNLAKPAAAPAPVPTAPAAPGELLAPEVRPLSMMRKAIARRLTESKQTVPHFYLTIDVDVAALVALREHMNADLAATAEKGTDPPKISVNDLLVKACAIALRRVPECNAQFTPESILVHRRVDISVAVAVADGLVTPVVRDADKKNVAAIAAEIRDLAGRARAKKLRPEEMANGTFSISNLGMYGIDEFSAVINPPEGAILAVGQVRNEPVVQGDKVVPGKKMAMTLSCDHRVVDGAVGATFLKALRALLEHPTQILYY